MRRVDDEYYSEFTTSLSLRHSRLLFSFTIAIYKGALYCSPAVSGIDFTIESFGRFTMSAGADRVSTPWHTHTRAVAGTRGTSNLIYTRRASNRSAGDRNEGSRESPMESSREFSLPINTCTMLLHYAVRLGE